MIKPHSTLVPFCRFRTWYFFVALTLSATCPVAGQTTLVVDAETFEARVIQAIIANPEVVLIALQKIEEQKTAREKLKAKDVVDKHHTELFGEDGAYKLVEFFDYRCGYCSRAAPDVQQLSDAYEGQVRLIELPILGPDSRSLSKYSLAVRDLYGEHVYRTFHYALMEPSAAQRGLQAAHRIANIMGLDTDKIDQVSQSEKIDDQIMSNLVLARSLKITGTPAFVSREGIHAGMQAYDEMEKAILK